MGQPAGPPERISLFPVPAHFDVSPHWVVWKQMLWPRLKPRCQTQGADLPTGPVRNVGSKGQKWNGISQREQVCLQRAVTFGQLYKFACFAPTYDQESCLLNLGLCIKLLFPFLVLQSSGWLPNCENIPGPARDSNQSLPTLRTEAES